MDKIANYSQIIEDLLNEYSFGRQHATTGVRREVIVDKQNHHYQLLSVGWKNGTFTFLVAFHLDIINGKIWIQQNNTEVMVADELIERGVDKADIVLGFLSEETRPYSGFAVS